MDFPPDSIPFRQKITGVGRDDMRSSMIWIMVALLVCATEGYCGTIEVPGKYPTVAQAVTNAEVGDTILITDSGTYLDPLVISKKIVVKASPGQTPKIVWNEKSLNMLSFSKGSKDTQFGSNDGGRIIIDGVAQTSSTLEYMIDFNQGGGNQVTLENLQIVASGNSNCEIIYATGENDFTVRNCILDGRDKADRLMQILGNASGNYVFENCKVVNFVSYGLYAEGKPVITIRKCEFCGDINDPTKKMKKRSIGCAGENSQITLAVEDSVIRGGGNVSGTGPSLGGGATVFLMTGEKGPMSNISFKRCLVYSTSQNALCLYQGATYTIDHCDIITDTGCGIYTQLQPSIVNNANLTVTNCNIVARGKGGRALTGAMPIYIDFSHNNIKTDPGYTGMVELGDTRYSSSEYLHAASDGTAIGTNRNFAEILTNRQ